MLDGLAGFVRDAGVLTLGYWATDRALRLDGLARAAARLGLAGKHGQAGLWASLGLLAAPWYPWRAVPEGAALGLLATLLIAALSWRATTRDIDVVEGQAQRGPRLLLVACALGSYFSPALAWSAVLLLSSGFSMWQHHATLPMRVLQAVLAFAGLSPLLRGVDVLQSAASLVWLLVVIQLSHYLITALAKAYLGPHWYSWPKDNHLHHMAASAYSWGWARFIAWPRWRRVIGLARRLEPPLQWSVFGLELLAPLALLHPHLAAGFGLAWAAFHLGVFALSGLLFWEWVVTDLALVWLVTQLSQATQGGAFGPWPLALGGVWLIAFPLRHKLWKPMPLGWWDTPFTQRMHWRVRGASGSLYGLYADFMDPHERIYGKVHGCFLTPVPVLTYHLGEAWRHELRDGLRACEGLPQRLDILRQEFGVLPRSRALADNHRAYLARFCWELNQGAPKHVLPRALRWLKAPGGQCYYWGELPAYRRQEPIVELEVVYREEFFDGDHLQRLHDEVVMHVPIDPHTPPPAAAPEPTPKQLDDHLLSFAAGRLIRLPGLGDGFVGGDDGARSGQLEGELSAP